MKSCFSLGDIIEFGIQNKVIVRGVLLNINNDGGSGCDPKFHIRPLENEETTTKMLTGDYLIYYSDMQNARKIKLFDYNDLKKKTPCNDGYIWFLENFGHEKVTYEEVENRIHKYKSIENRDGHGWIEWMKKNLSEYADLPVYQGKFYVGQPVYLQNYGMGSWLKTKIADIERSADNTHFIFKIQAETDHNGKILYQYRGEKDLFVSLEHLKANWIEQIANMKEIK